MIKYDGEFAKKFDEFTNKYSDVITVVSRRVPHSTDTSGVLVRSSFYFDIKIDGVIYDIIAVGDYGYGFCPYIIPKSFPRNCLTHKLTCVEDVNKYRLPDIGHNKDYYEKRIIPEVITPSDIIQDSVFLNREKFLESLLYRNYLEYRKRKAEELGCKIREVFTTNQLCDFLSTFPYKAASYYPINKDIQEDLIDIWDRSI